MDEFTVWVWSETLRNMVEPAELYLFNVTPPHGNLPANLAQLSWRWRCGGLVVFKLIPTTFEIHFGEVKTPPAHTYLQPGRTLLAVLQSIPPKPEDTELAGAIAEIACTRGSLVRSKKSLEEYLRDIVVSEMHSEASFPVRSTVTLEDKLRGVRRVSIWTPGMTENAFLQFYAPLIGKGEAQQLWTISRSSIEAVAKGDFAKQVSLSTELASIVPENSVLAGEAAYFKGEGLRLLADIDPVPAKREELRAQAIEQYAQASILLDKDPRPLRGLGRITELKGDLDGALKYFTIAKGLCLIEGAHNSLTSDLDLAHEILRTTRHFVHCLLDIRTTNPASVWHRVRKEQELQGYLQECENLHLEHMPRFQVDPEWYYIEWFMGFVFLARAWGSLGHYAQMQRTLVKALDARRRMLRTSAQLSTVERANLDWWIRVAKTGTDGFEPEFATAVGRLEEALEENDFAGLELAIEDIVGPFVPPWSFD
jgi:hypothetical protein